MITHSACKLRRWALAVALGSLVTSASRKVSAEDPATPVVTPAADGAQRGEQPDPAAYTQAIAAGIEEYDLGHYLEARVHFQRAHALEPSARTLRALGNVEFELRNYGDAARWLHAALASDKRALDARLRDETEAVLAKARAYLGQVHVNVEPEVASVIVDGVTVASGPEASLELLVGEHVLEFRAGGLASERRIVHVKSGERTTIEVRLAPLGHAPMHSAFEIRSRPRDELPRARRRWLWAVGSTAVAALAVGLGVGLSRHGVGSAGEPSGGSTNVVLENP